MYMRIGTLLEILNESTKKKQTRCLPLNPKNLKRNELYLCANTHPSNIGLNILSGTAMSSIIAKLIWPECGLLTLLKQGLIISSIISLPVILEQAMARDFMLIKKGNEGYESLYSDDLLGHKIYSIDDGTVCAVKHLEMPYGNAVCIKHHDGTYSLYAHLKEKGVLVKHNQKVKKGQVIGLAGSTGNSTGCHLHFEMCYTNPTDSFLPIGHPLNNFEDHKMMPLSLRDLYFFGDQKVSFDFIFDRVRKSGLILNNTGEIESLCVIGK